LRTAVELYRQRYQAQGTWRRGSSGELEERARAAQVSGQRQNERGRGEVGCAGTCRGGRCADLELGGDEGAAISACVCAVRAGERLKEGGETGEWGPRGSGTDARAHDRPKRRQGDPTEQREGEREERRGSALTGGARLLKTEGARAQLGLVGRLGCFALFFFPEFTNCFSISFSLGFSIQIQFKLIQPCATTQRIFKLSMMQHVMTHSVLAKIDN
jgi:hypothetical protein